MNEANKKDKSPFELVDDAPPQALRKREAIEQKTPSQEDTQRVALPKVKAMPLRPQRMPEQHVFFEPSRDSGHANTIKREAPRTSLIDPTLSPKVFALAQQATLRLAEAKEEANAILREIDEHAKYVVHLNRQRASVGEEIAFLTNMTSKFNQRADLTGPEVKQPLQHVQQPNATQVAQALEGDVSTLAEFCTQWGIQATGPATHKRSYITAIKKWEGKR